MNSTTGTAKPAAKRRPGTPGVCAFCDRTCAKGGMARHLEVCSARQAMRLPDPAGSTHLIVESGHTGGAYWMHLEVANSATLDDLDAFLRGIWLECCGHLSAFTISSRLHTDALGWNDDPDGDEDAPSEPIGQALQPGDVVGYDYDFGSTTHLTIRVRAQNPFRSGEGPVVVLARNAPLEWTCTVCGAPATQVCPDCLWKDAGFLCETCVPGHARHADRLLPVVNSPRMGVCGYAG